MDPANRSVEAVARLLTDEGQKDREDGSWRSLVMVGRPTITNPLIRQAVRVTAQSCSITTTCCRRKRWGLGGCTSPVCNINGSVRVVVVVVVVDIVAGEIKELRCETPTTLDFFRADLALYR